MSSERKRESFDRERIIQIVKRLIELKLDYWKKGHREEPYSPEYYQLIWRSDGIAKALEVIDGFLNFDTEIHQLIDDSRK